MKTRPGDGREPDDRGADQEDVQADAGPAQTAGASRAARGVGARGADGDARHVWRSWNELETKTTIGTIEISIRMTAIAEP